MNTYDFVTPKECRLVQDMGITYIFRACSKAFIFATWLFWYPLTGIPAPSEEDRALANTISEDDLEAYCPARFLEIHLDAETDSAAGLAILKFFYMVDPMFMRNAANSYVNGDEFGKILGETFRRYCEQEPLVSVGVAVKQAITYMEWQSAE